MSDLSTTDCGEPTQSKEGWSVPDDFPRDPYHAALAGTQNKLSARFIDGEYLVGLTPEERTERYLACLYLVEPLTAYVHRERAEKPDVPLSEVLDNLAKRIPHQWGGTLGFKNQSGSLKVFGRGSRHHAQTHDLGCRSYRIVQPKFKRQAKGPMNYSGAET